jgi:hypothetical protein
VHTTYQELHILPWEEVVTVRSILGVADPADSAGATGILAVAADTAGQAKPRSYFEDIAQVEHRMRLEDFVRTAGKIEGSYDWRMRGEAGDTMESLGDTM